LIIGILSDTHNHQKNTQTALAVLREREVQTVIHCGDITTPSIVELFAGLVRSRPNIAARSRWRAS
jgi:predicted phosphodiesterase